EHGPCIFISHQWTSTSHPDPTTLQLTTLQAVLRTIIKGEMPSLFRDPKEWKAFLRAAAPFSSVSLSQQKLYLSAEQMAEEVASAQVWLDYASVPQVPPVGLSRLSRSATLESRHSVAHPAYGH
ncbi:MAG: hypothetical protein SGPRY_010580, partial [Prymnesium sp.]